MTAVDHAELKRLAERLRSGHYTQGDRIRIATLSEALLSEIEGLKAERDRLKLAICGGEDAPGAINAVSVDDCERFIRDERSRHDWSAEQQAELDALRTQAPDSWRPIETAPKDGTAILAWCVHPHARWAGDDREWAAPVVTSWTTHNGGGWTWHGMIGEFTHWMPAPSSPLALRPQTAESGK